MASFRFGKSAELAWWGSGGASEGGRKKKVEDAPSADLATGLIPFPTFFSQNLFAQAFLH